MVDMIDIGDHQTLLYTKYICSGPNVQVIDTKMFKVFSRYMSMRAIDTQGCGQFAPKGLN